MTEFLAWYWMRSFWDIFKSLLLYHQTVLRLIWRAGLSPDFARVMAVEGQMRGREAQCLYELAQGASREGVIVEIGSYRGLSTIALARGSLRGARIPVYTIDPHEATHNPHLGEVYGPRDNIAFFKNILFSGVTSIVGPINMLSVEAVNGWEKPISLLWIDGNHAYESVREDFLSWSKFVVLGGWVAFHDAADPEGGPYRVIQEALEGEAFRLYRKAEKVSVLCKI